MMQGLDSAEVSDLTEITGDGETRKLVLNKCMTQIFLNSFRIRHVGRPSPVLGLFQLAMLIVIIIILSFKFAFHYA